MAVLTQPRPVDALPLQAHEARPKWQRPAVVGLLVATAALYIWGLSASGWANAFYSAAAQAGADSWKALFFGSSDAANSITVDKTPASVWVMALSVKVFGLNSWSILVPQALQGVAAVGVLYATVRRWFGPVAGLIAGGVLALTPVAVLIFRFNNPDSLLVLLLVCGAYATVRATENASTGWLMLAATCVGFGFLTKMLQALLVVPAFALVYLIVAPTTLRRRMVQLGLAAVALVASAGWWIAIVELVPAEYRPYIGGSQTNSILELTLGYNGLGRLTGDEVGSVGGGNDAASAGLSRLFDTEMGGQIAWLLPAALLLGAAGLWFTRRAPRTDRKRAAFLLWGGWLLVTGLVFSYMNGIIHAYYTVALAPAIGALVGMGWVTAWRARHEAGAVVLSLTVAATSLWAFVLLGRTSGWQPWLRAVVPFGGLAVAALLLLLGQLRRRAAQALITAGLVAALAAPTAYSVATAAAPHSGAIPSAGPAGSGMGFGGGGGGGGLTGGGGMGNLLDAPAPGDDLVALLRSDSSSYTWVAAAIGSNNAAGYQLAVDAPVMAVGGFNGTDPAPTLAEFQTYVLNGQIHYFVGGQLMGSDSGSDASAEIAEWVAANFTASTVDGVTIYDLTR